MNNLDITPRPTRKTRSKGAKPPIEARLLSAAESLLAKGKNFATLSVDQLAKEAGISRGTFYLHFRDKGELVSRLMDFFLQELASSLGTWTQNAQEAERADVMIAVKAMLKVFKKHEIIIIAVRETAPQDENVRKAYNQMMKKIARMAVKSTATVKRHGKGRPETTKVVAAVLAKLIVLYSTYLIDGEDDDSLEFTADALGKICSNTIFADDK